MKVNSTVGAVNNKTIPCEIGRKILEYVISQMLVMTQMDDSQQMFSHVHIYNVTGNLVVAVVSKLAS